MTHELKKIVEASITAKEQGSRGVLASVVDLDGSSYRRPGVRMLILENGKMIGAVSGGCVEKEIQRQAATVFNTGEAKLMTYDGRYRLGCEGVLYILLEIFNPYKTFTDAFTEGMKNRTRFDFISFYQKKEGVCPEMGSYIQFSGGEEFSVSQEGVNSGKEQESLSFFMQRMKPCFRLIIIGAEHDAVQLSAFAAMSGWEVTVITAPSDPKTPENFPGATEVLPLSAEELNTIAIDKQTAVVLMTHNFANDLKHLIALKNDAPLYLGLLGPSGRREKLLSQLMEYDPDIEDRFLDTIYGPAGLNIGAETPQEIAISIISEILSVTRKQQPMPLREKISGIHS